MRHNRQDWRQFIFLNIVYSCNLTLHGASYGCFEDRTVRKLPGFVTAMLRYWKAQEIVFIILRQITSIWILEISAIMWAVVVEVKLTPVHMQQPGCRVLSITGWLFSSGWHFKPSKREPQFTDDGFLWQRFFGGRRRAVHRNHCFVGVPIERTNRWLHKSTGREPGK